MTFARFFVDRPIFAVVLSLLMLIAGGLAIFQLPLGEYPAVSPPTVVVRAAYPGANPDVVSETVAAPIEQEVNGVEGMLYMSSQSTTDGRMSLTVTFAQGTDPDRAQVQVQNRVARALPRLPVEVQRMGVVTEKTSPDVLMVVHLVSPDASRDPLYLSNYALRNVEDELTRIPGVGQIAVWGAGEYAMRVWLDPARLTARGLTTGDVLGALREQNVQVAAGVVGQSPGSSAAHELAITAGGRFSEVEEFEEVIVNVGPAGELTRLRDVARVELGADGYALRSLLDGEPAVAMQVILTPGANALEVAAGVRARMGELEHAFPEGVAFRIAYDPTVFVRASIENVGQTLLEAILLVVLVVVLFLKTWRASLIPLAAVPVSLVGTAAVMYLFGFSLDTLSLFGLVLSIGIVVDDAIVVVENVERHLARGLSAKEAARAAMAEVTGPIIAITSVLAAVFLPTALLGGLTGLFYRQFALTIAISTILSAINSLTLSPALAGLLLKGHHGEPTGRVDRLLARWVFGPFDRGFDAASEAYARLVRRMLRSGGVAIALFVALLGLTGLGLAKLPSGFVPMQDKYYLVGITQLPPASSLDRTEDVMKRVSKMALEEPGVASVVAFPGLSINGFVQSPNEGVLFAMLDPFEDRTDPSMSAAAIAGRLQGRFMGIQEGFVGVFPPPPVPGLGSLGGFKMQVEDRAGHGPEALHEATTALLARAAQEPTLSGLMSSYRIHVPRIDLDIDREKAKRLGVPLGDLFETLQVHLGSVYVNDFSHLGRPYKVIAQADAPFRMEPTDVHRLKVRSATGEMVPLGSLVEVAASHGPDRVVRHNGYLSADVTGAAAPGHSSGAAVATMERLAGEVLPDGMAFEWTELTLQEKLSGGAGKLVFPLAVLLAFLLLAAQFDSWSLPVAALLTVPLAVTGAVFGVWLVGAEVNLFTQIGFVVLIGLSAKNAILIVEFARAREAEGADAVEAAIEACRLRLRPILMTSLAFVMGVVPLATATGAGAEMRRAMGTAVLSGMLGVTVFGLVLTPVFYVLVRRFATRSAPRSAAHAARAAALAIAVGVGLLAPREASALTLDQALDEAGRQNLDLQAAEARLQQADQASARALAGYLPRVEVGAAYTRHSSEVAITPDIVVQPLDQLGFRASATQALLAPGVWASMREASRLESVARAERASVERDVLFLVAVTFHGAAAAQEAVRVHERLVEVTTRREADTRARWKAGTVPEIAVHRAELDRTRAAQELLGARNALAGARLTLATLLQRSADFELELPARVETAAQPDDGALDRRPDVAAARGGVDLAQARLGSARAGYLPTVALAASFQTGNADNFVGEPTTWSAGVVASWTIWDGGAREAATREAAARVQEATATARAAEARAHEEIARATLDLGTARGRLAQAEQAVELARSSHRLAEAAFRAGGAGYLEVADAEAALTSAEVALVAERLRVGLAEVTLRHATGALAAKP